jgi:hypothetical protein
LLEPGYWPAEDLSDQRKDVGWVGYTERHPTEVEIGQHGFG